MDADTLRRQLEFYQDLGITTLYRRQTPPAAAEPAPEVAPPPVSFEPQPESAAPLPGLAPENDTLLKIIEDIGDCRRCRLHLARHKIVFGVGNEQARLVFVGE